MNLRQGDSLVGMAIISSQILADQAALMEAESDDDSDEEVNDSKKQGPWILVVTTGGYGKRVPVNMFRLQRRGGMGIIATKFRKKNDTLVGLTMVTDGEELMIVTNRGIIIRQATDAISIQSRPASGVRLQRLDDANEIVAIAVVPLADAEEDLDDGLQVLDADGNPVVLEDAALAVEAATVLEDDDEGSEEE
jgi:DNA gyrase subunit A